MGQSSIKVDSFFLCILKQPLIHFSNDLSYLLHEKNTVFDNTDNINAVFLFILVNISLLANCYVIIGCYSK